MEINWLWVALAVGLVYSSLFIFFLAKRQWTAAALGVALGNFVWVLPNLVAPFRGVLDPGYRGYSLGALQLSPGIQVTFAAGAVVAVAMAAAVFALLNRPGRSMAFIAVVDSVLLLVLALPELLNGLLEPSAFSIEGGEYLQIPGPLSLLIVGSLMCLPLVASIVWSARRMSPLTRSLTYA